MGVKDTSLQICLYKHLGFFARITHLRIISVLPVSRGFDKYPKPYNAVDHIDTQRCQSIPPKCGDALGETYFIQAKEESQPQIAPVQKASYHDDAAQNDSSPFYKGQLFFSNFHSKSIW